MKKAITRTFWISLPGGVVAPLSFWVWEWGPKYTVFTLFFLYMVIYFTWWFLTDFWDNM